MSDQVKFEMRLEAAVNVLATKADGPVDSVRIASSAINASRNAGWWTRLTSIEQPQADGLPGLSIRPLLVTMLAIVAIGSVTFGISWLRGTNVGPPPSTATPTPSPTDSAPTPSDSKSPLGPGSPQPRPEVAKGWPNTGPWNPPGVYSWDGPRSATGRGFRCAGGFCVIGIMHKSDVGIHLDVVPEGTFSDDGATPVTVAGHDGSYRQIDGRARPPMLHSNMTWLPGHSPREEWIVDIEGTTIAIRLTARPGASEADLADAHAIIESMRYEPRDNDFGFRLVFTLTNDDWSSG